VLADTIILFANNTIVDAEETSICIAEGYNNLVADNHIILEHTFDIWAAIVVWSWSFNNTISGNTIYYNHPIDRRSPISGILLQYASYNHVQNNMMFGVQQGIFVSYSYNNIIANNKIHNVTYGDAGIRNMWTPTCDAIQLYHSSGNFIADNRISSVDNNAILVWENSTNNMIQANLIDQSYDGIMLHYSSDNNTVVNNNLKGITSWDITLDESSGNIVYDNIFEGKPIRILDSGTNSWNSSAVGNYWGDYVGTDDNSDGIGDASYMIQPNGTDYLPLMKPPSIWPFSIPTTDKMNPFLMGDMDYCPGIKGNVKRLIVSGTETWKDITVSYVSVHVTSEANLTLVNVTLELSPNQNLVLQSGASLYIYNSTITSAISMFGGYQIRAEQPRALVVKNSIIENGGAGYAGDWGAVVSGNWGNVTSSVTVENNLFRHDYIALSLFSPGTARVLNNTIEYGYCGLYTMNANASDNSISNMIYVGLYGFEGIPGDDGIIPPHFENNTISNSWGAGIILSTPPEGLPVRYNTITDSEEGIRINSGDWSGWPGFRMNNATVLGNTITHSTSWALRVKVYENHAANILVSDNLIKYNGKGIYLEPGTHNITIYHNNIINSPNSTDFGHNLWTYSGEGNYWSDYTGVDVKSGSNQNLSGSDGVGDTPKLIETNGVDYSPLMYPYGSSLPQMYSLIITTNAEGTTDPAPGVYNYTTNSTVQVKALPNAGCLFSHWLLGNITVYGSPLNIIMDANQTLLPYFIDIESPVVDAGLNRTVNIGETVNFDASSSSDNVGIASYEWNFGDGTSGIGKTATHEYKKAGDYIVTLTVKDAEGNQAINTIVVTVNPTEAFQWWIVAIAGIIAVGTITVALIFWRGRKRPAG
jgi:parallel beta-helix repeat protein